eukprot:Tamp_05914.p1 GENE.Tamp_05914~~Tamp_05914.p1  ORF type:complete len:675 (-),score=34.23 Tamp_05914:768-2792(-)
MRRQAVMGVLLFAGSCALFIMYGNARLRLLFEVDGVFTPSLPLSLDQSSRHEIVSNLSHNWTHRLERQDKSLEAGELFNATKTRNNHSFTMAKLKRVKSACEKAFQQHHRTRPKHGIVQSPYQHKHDSCRGWRLLHRLTDMFIGATLFFEESSGSHILHGLLFDCRRADESAHRSWSVHDVTFFTRAVGPHIVAGVQTSGYIFSIPVVHIRFDLLAAGNYTVEMKMRWLGEMRDLREAKKYAFKDVNVRNSGPVFLGGSETRTCSYCKIPRLLPHCEADSHVWGSNVIIPVVRAWNQSFLHLPLAQNSESWRCNDAGTGRWIPFKHTCAITGCKSGEGLFSGDAESLASNDAKAELSLPTRLQTRRWFFQPDRDRYHLYSGNEIAKCFTERQLDRGAVLVLGDSQARTLWGGITHVAGRADVNETYLRKVKNFLNTGGAQKGFVTRERVSRPGFQDLDFLYVQEWGQGGVKFWDQVAEKTGLFTSRVSTVIYNAGSAHKGDRHLETFLEWWRARKRQWTLHKASGKQVAPWPLQFFLNQVTLQGMRNPGWHPSNFLKIDDRFRNRYSAEGWVMIDALVPTAAVGIDTTGEGGADGFHYSTDPHYNMIAQIFFNLVCNGGIFTLDNELSKDRWLHSKNITGACTTWKGLFTRVEPNLEKSLADMRVNFWDSSCIL